MRGTDGIAGSRYALAMRPTLSLSFVLFLCLIPAVALADTAAPADKGHDLWTLVVPALTAIVVVLLGALITMAVTQQKDHAAARYLAARLAVILEAYAINSANSLNEWDTYQITGAEQGAMIEGVPDLPEYPDGDGWSALRPDMVERALSLRNQLAIGRLDVASLERLIDDHDEIAERCAEHVGACGYTAVVLARALRRRYDLQAFDPTRTFWDVEPTLRQRHDRIVNRNRPRVRSYVFPFG